MPIALRSDFDATTLRRLARRTKDSAQARRLLSLAVIYDGGSRAQAAETGGVTRQIVRDWVVKFNADGPEGLIDRKISGRPSKLDETHRDAWFRLLLGYNQRQPYWPSSEGTGHPIKFPARLEEIAGTMALPCPG